MVTCAICGHTLENRKGLSYHSKVIHDLPFEQYVLRYEHDGIAPVCACGCGTKVKFYGGTFTEWVGHHYHKGRPKTAAHRASISKTQTGRTLPQTHKDNIRTGVTLAHKKDPSIAARSSAANKAPKSPEHCAKISATRTERIASGAIEIQGDKISDTDTISQMYVDGGFEWAKGVHRSPKTGHKHTFRSSYELIYYTRLDADPTVSTYETEFTRIPYTLSDGSMHRYVPDLHVKLIDGTDCFVEVKPHSESLRNAEKNAAKREVAQAFCAEHGWLYSDWPSEEEQAELTDEYREAFLLEYAAAHPDAFFKQEEPVA